MGTMQPDDAAVRAQLQRILASDAFAPSKRLSRFLRFAVERALAGRLEELREYHIAMEVYERGPDFDPKVDNIVRMEASRLRGKLRDYYENSGKEDAVRIDIPKGGYAPVFLVVKSEEPKHPPKLRIAAVLLALIAVAAVVIVWYFRAQRPAVGMRRSIAILDLKQIGTPDTDAHWISTALAELLTMDLAEDGRVRAIRADRVEEMNRDLGLGPADGLPAAALRRIRNRIGADLVVAGSCTEISGDGQISVNLRVQDTGSGRTIATISIPGSREGLLRIAAEAGAELRARLNLPPAPGPLPDVASNPGAMRLYSEGLDQFRQMNTALARELFEQSIAADPSNPLCYAALADALYALGYELKARDAAQKALTLASHLSRNEQLEIEGRYRSYASQWSDAIRIYSTLWRAAPDSIDDALMLADCQTRAGRFRDALATISRIRTIRGVDGDPRVDFAEATALRGLTDYRGALDHIRVAERKAKDRGARSEYAEARLFESGAMQVLGLPHVAEVRAEARALCEQLGDRAGVLHAMRSEAVRVVHDSPAKAKILFEQALAMARPMGAMRETANLLEGLAVADSSLGDLAGAEKAFKDALEVEREQGVDTRESELDLADVYTAEGRLGDAEVLEESAARSAREKGDKETLGNALAGMATILRLRGKIGQSVARSREALALARETGSTWSIAQILMIDGNSLAAAGNYDAALNRYREARELSAQWPSSVGGIEAAVGEVLLDRGSAAEAESHLRLAASQLRSAGMADDQWRAQAALVRALLAEHKNHEAVQLAVETKKAAAKTENAEVRLEVQLAAARAASAAGSSAAANAPGRWRFPPKIWRGYGRICR